jgi:hypothetical protein
MEPRVQLKFNPDGKNKEVYSFSIAKLASAYSDQIANLFRGDEWDMRTIQFWSGAGLGVAQPGFDTAAGQNDTPTGNYNGYSYTGANMHGVRFVNYDAIIDPANYGATGAIFNNRANNLTHDFKAPYTYEYNLGYQRNYETGFFKLNLVDRIYKDNWVAGWRDYGTQFMVKQNSPKAGDPFHAYTGTVNFSNSTNDSTYLSLELNFQKQLTTRLNMGGSYTWAQMTGTNDSDYYMWRTLQASLLTPQQRANAVGQGYLAKTNTAHLWLTYVHPVGKGNVSFSLKADSWENGSTASVVGYSDYAADVHTASGFNTQTAAITSHYNTLDPTAAVNIIDSRGGIWGGVGRPAFATYYGKMGDYKNGVDYYQAGFKIQAEIPIGLGKTRLISYFTINNLLNHGILTNVYGVLNNDGYNAGAENFNGGNASGPAGRLTASFKRPYGQAGSDTGNYGNGGDGGARSVGEFSIGLKF